MENDEKKPPTIPEMLEQMLRNQIALFGWVANREQTIKDACERCVKDTAALLDRIA